jgi:beta-phosphoglucomutase-like phosphatase (HAD superfamily)/choline kinase
MNIIIPLGGKGERFYKEGYSQPKPLIKIMNKEMIFWVLDNLIISNEDKIFICYRNDLDTYDFSSIIAEKYPKVICIPINHQTAGAVETISVSLKSIFQLDHHKKCVLLDCDTFYTQDILGFIRNSPDNMVFYTKKDHTNPIYSYIEINPENCITNIQEKIKISSNANTGCYVFNDIKQLENLCNYVLKNNINFNGESYTSCAISQLIKESPVKSYKLDEKCVFSVGTPHELKTFIDNSFVFLFDLDGTLVNTDEIYLNVWKQILSKYNIHLTSDMFFKYIQGNNDEKVVNVLIPTANLTNISILKDDLFIQNIDNIIIINGVVDFFKSIKKSGYSCSIVTNCNRKVAEHIINYCKLDKYIDYLTIGNECKRSKPYPDPYQETIEKYNINNKKVIIFEDSKSGLLSARQTDPLCIVGITTTYSDSDLLSYGSTVIINDYINTSPENIIKSNILSNYSLESYIKNSTLFDIKYIVIDNAKLKGGFISDVISLTINDLKCVLKLENKNVTMLSKMANVLGLYERENYFYENISKYINIKLPHFYGLIRDDKMNTIGILMENLNETGNYKLNLNLNTENIDVSLQVISELSKFHSKFWNKDIKKVFPELKPHNDQLFNPVWHEFIKEKWESFVENWKYILTAEQLTIAEKIISDFPNIQERLSNNNLTIIHGDVKSPNIFYDLNNNYKPVFLDWQYIAIGKGIQDIIFFLIESFDLDNIKINFPIFKNYYYRKLIENGIHNYSFNDYEKDIKDSVCYFPFFVAMWFGTVPQEDLIDKNFPFFFIQKLFYFLSIIF